MKTFFDNFGNVATITKTKILPYNGAKEKESAFVLKCLAAYDNNICYFLSIYETEQEAKNKLKTLSCGTFKQK